MSTQDWYVRKTRACAKKLPQKVPIRSSSGTDSMHLAQHNGSTSLRPDSVLGDIKALLCTQCCQNM